jgi:hypothetical protein
MAAAAAVTATLGVGLSLGGAIGKAMTKDDQQGCLGRCIVWLMFSKAVDYRSGYSKTIL